MKNLLAARKIVKVLVVIFFLSSVVAVTDFVLGRLGVKAPKAGAPEEKLEQSQPTDENKCLTNVPEIVLVKDEQKIEENLTVTSLNLVVTFKSWVSSRDVPGGVRLSGFVEGKNQDWETIIPLVKHIIDPRGESLPCVVRIPVWEFSQDSFIPQQPESVRVKYSLEVLGCAGISDYTNEIELTGISK